MDGWIDVHFPVEKLSFVIKLFTMAGFCALCIVHCACRFFLKVDHLRILMAIQLVLVWQLCYQLKWWSTRWKSIIHKITRLQTVSKPPAQPEWQSCLCTKPSSNGNGNGNYVCAYATANSSSDSNGNGNDNGNGNYVCACDYQAIEPAKQTGSCCRIQEKLWEAVFTDLWEVFTVFTFPLFNANVFILYLL